MSPFGTTAGRSRYGPTRDARSVTLPAVASGGPSRPRCRAAASRAGPTRCATRVGWRWRNPRRPWGLGVRPHPSLTKACAPGGASEQELDRPSRIASRGSIGLRSGSPRSGRTPSLDWGAGERPNPRDAVALHHLQPNRVAHLVGFATVRRIGLAPRSLPTMRSGIRRRGAGRRSERALQPVAGEAEDAGRVAGLGLEDVEDVARPAEDHRLPREP